MDIPCVDSILFKPAREIWPDEHEPSLAYVDLMDAIPHLLKAKAFDEARESLEQITQLGPQLSQTMRLRYWFGEYYSRTHNYVHAFESYDQALSIAMEAEDLDSMICLSFTAANALFNSVRSEDALEYFDLALSYWHTKATDLDLRCPDTEMILQTAIARQKWSIGELDESHRLLAQVLTLAKHERSMPHTPQVSRQTANAFWQLALVFRAQSDMHDGESGYLRDALRRMRRANTLYERINAEPEQIGRLAIQIAEIYLDLAEIHLQRHAMKAASAMRDQGFAYIDRATVYLSHTDDNAANVLARITRLRAIVMWPSAPLSAQEYHDIEADFAAIDRNSASLKDPLLHAKTATLRAEWLMSLGDKEAARAALLYALKGFKQGGMGMATRAQRLLRRLNASDDINDINDMSDSTTNSQN